MNTFNYFNTEYAIYVHDKIIEKSGGLLGLNNLNLLQSPLEHIQNDDYYHSIVDKLTHLFYSINKNHAFKDGNKRASIALSAFFMEINGFSNIITEFIEKIENIAIYVAENRINKELLHKVFYSILFEDDYSEELKLELFRAIEDS